LIWEKLRKSKRDGGLGFSDLYGFNLAMLARQAWIMPALESSCAVLKAKYFPNNSILNAQPMGGMSYSWHSILKGVALLRAGVIWRIGDSLEVDIRSDPWIARDGSQRPFTP
jgi:hypothetical protein